MEKKVILISIDGMRPDGLQQCGNPYVKELEKMCAYTYNGSSVFPSVTLPCHFSMTHSAVPQRHGILTNIGITFATTSAWTAVRLTSVSCCRKIASCFIMTIRRRSAARTIGSGNRKPCRILWDGGTRMHSPSSLLKG